MTGPQVEALQEALNKLSKSKIEVDGDFGPATEEALKFFQKINGINATGVFEIQTFTTMKAALEKQKAIEALMPKSQTTNYTDVMLGSSSKDENGQYVGGLAGDQTGKEVYILNWYGKNWTSVIRPNNNDLAEKIALACEAGCKNDMIGYSQSTRNTLLT
jgi:peptidoglycan hydrolase-like protein with peptidoglycan-binding domain